MIPFGNADTLKLKLLVEKRSGLKQNSQFIDICGEGFIA